MFRTILASVLSAIVISLGALWSTSATAQDALPRDRIFFNYAYFEARGGAALSPNATLTLFNRKDDYVADDGFAFAGAIGTYVMPLVRLEAEFWFVEADGGRLPALAGPNSFSGETNVYGGMVNVIHEFNVDPSFTPFAGVGLGFAVYDVDQTALGITFDDTDTTFAAAVHAGIDVGLTDAIDFTARYSMIYNGSTDYQDTTGTIALHRGTSFNHMLTAGFRVNVGQLFP